MNSNLSIYMGAYIDFIHQIGILASNKNQSILYIIPYLNQMRIDYKIYANETLFFSDIASFCPNALLFDGNDFNIHKIWNELINVSTVDVISINTTSPQVEFLKEGGYFVTIFNPKTLEQLNIFHSNIEKNIAKLMALNYYQNIEIEYE